MTEYVIRLRVCLLNFWYSTDEICISTHFIHAWTTYLHVPVKVKIGNSALPVLSMSKIKHSVKRPWIFFFRTLKYVERELPKIPQNIPVLILVSYLTYLC